MGNSFLDYIKHTRGIRKILMAGSGGVGKTSIVKALHDGKPLSELAEQGEDLSYHRTPYLNLISVKTANVSTDHQPAGELVFYDIAGQLSLPIHAIRDDKTSTMAAVDLIMMVFDGTNTQSLFELGEWMELLKEVYIDAPKFPDIILIKNKSETPSNVDSSLIESFIDSEDKIVKYFEVSSMNGLGLLDMMNWVISFLYGDK